MILIGLASYAGTIIVALLSWAESKEKFIARKFIASALRGLIVAAGVSVAANLQENLQASNLVLAFISGAGGDALIKSGIGAGRKAIKK